MRRKNEVLRQDYFCSVTVVVLRLPLHARRLTIYDVVKVEQAAMFAYISYKAAALNAPEKVVCVLHMTDAAASMDLS